MLSGARDAQVKLETLAALRERFEDRLSADRLAAPCLVHALDNAYATRGRRAEARSRGPSDRDQPGHGEPSAAAARQQVVADRPSASSAVTGVGETAFRSGRAEASDEVVHGWPKTRQGPLRITCASSATRRSRCSARQPTRRTELSDLLGDHENSRCFATTRCERRELTRRRRETWSSSSSRPLPSTRTNSEQRGSPSVSAAARGSRRRWSGVCARPGRAGSER